MAVAHPHFLFSEHRSRHGLYVNTIQKERKGMEWSLASLICDNSCISMIVVIVKHLKEIRGVAFEMNAMSIAKPRAFYCENSGNLKIKYQTITSKTECGSNVVLF